MGKQNRKIRKSNIVSLHNVQSYQTEIAEMGRLRFSYETEDLFMNAITKGDADEAYRVMGEALRVQDTGRESLSTALQEAMQTSVGVMSRSDRKQVEYTAAICVSLFCRAAVRGGMDTQLAYDMADLYLQRISETTSPGEYWSILLDALDAYTGAVHKLLSMQTRSIHVLHAKQYIGRNLNKKLSLGNVASAVGISPSYLSAIFSQSEGTGLKEYILLQRIEAAKNLLTYSNMDIGAISSYLGFCSQSHFGKMFRLHTGMTPLVYRTAMQK